MNEKQAWLFIAKQFKEYSLCGHKTQYSTFGMCAAVDRLVIDNHISQSMCDAMHDKINHYGDTHEVSIPFFWPYRQEYALNRVEVCETFASQL